MTKKFYVILVAMIMGLSMTACGEKKEDSKPAVSSEESVESKEDEKEEKTIVGTVDEIKDFMFTVTTEDDKAYSFDRKEELEEDFKDITTGDKVEIHYTGEISEVDHSDCVITKVEKVS